MPPLPSIPHIELEVVRDRSREPRGFLTLRRYELSVASGGATSEPFPYDVVERRALDAAVIAAHHLDARGAPCVYLRSAVRPPVALRPTPPKLTGVLWELPAGLIEPEEDPRAGAARELYEELGFAVDPAALEPLGGWALPAPGFVGEMHWFFHVRVDPGARTEPTGDGSPLEAGAEVASVPVRDALEACRAGDIRDAKTELALRRLAELLG